MPRGGRRYGPDGKLLGGRPRKNVGVDGIQVKPNGDVLVPANVAHQVAQIATLAKGASPGDMLLSIARFHMGNVGEAQKVSRLPAVDKNYRPLDLNYVRTELALARESAKAAAPYCHRRLSAMAHTNPDGSPLDVAALAAILGKLPEGDVDQLERVLSLIAIASGAPAAAVDGGPAGTAPTSH